MRDLCEPALDSGPGVGDCCVRGFHRQTQSAAESEWVMRAEQPVL